MAKKKSKKGVNSMGKIYKMKPDSECRKIVPSYLFPKGAQGHMVLVLNTPNAFNQVRVATITGNNEVQGVNFYPIAPIPKKAYGRRLEIKHWNNQYYRSPLEKHSYLRLDPFMMPFELLTPLMGTREVWECTGVGWGGREYGNWYECEQQLELKAGSLRKLMQVMPNVNSVAIQAAVTDLTLGMGMLGF